MSPRRLQSATIFSMVTTSSAMRGIVRCSVGRRRLALLYSECHAHLRVPLRAGPHLRGHAEDDRRPGDELRALRRAGPARLPPGGRALQGQGLLQHRLRHAPAQPRDGALGQGRRRQDRVQVEGLGLVVLGLQEERVQEVGLQGRQEGLTHSRASAAKASRSRSMYWSAPTLTCTCMTVAPVSSPGGVYAALTASLESRPTHRPSPQSAKNPTCVRIVPSATTWSSTCRRVVPIVSPWSPTWSLAKSMPMT